MNVLEIEKRLEITEKALNEALKEIERLKNIKNKRINLKSHIDPEVFNDLFGFDYDKKTGLPKEADHTRKESNFKNLYTNVLMCMGYIYPVCNSKTGTYHAKVKPFKEIPNEDYEKLETLMGDITKLMYELKREVI